MTTCIRCHRPLKHPTESGLGPVCAKAVQPVAEVERDLFGYDMDRAVQAAVVRLEAFISTRADKARSAIAGAFKEARDRMEVLA